MEKRRMGTFTLGVCLLVFGILFMIHLFVKVVDYQLIFHLWPIIFIFLGGEVLYYAIRGADQKMKYDYAAVFLIIILAIFAMGMAGMDLVFEHIPADHWIEI